MATNNAINKFSDTLSMPSTNMAGDTGVIYVNSNRFMHSYGTGNTFLGESSGNLTLTTASAVNNTGIGGGNLSALTTGARNTALGTLAAFDMTSGVDNTAIGYNALTNMDQSNGNTAIGTSCLENATGNTALFNTGLGAYALNDVTTGSENTALGNSALAQITDGQNNIGIGIGAGVNYTGSESNNIVIFDGGTNGESNITRLGSEGIQTTCYLAGNVLTTTSTTSTTRTLTVENSDNTAAATSAATVQITVGGANVGDPTTKYTVTGANTFTMGIDNSDSDAFKLDASNGLGAGANTFRMTTAGERTMPFQPAFLGYLETADLNVTGNGTNYVLGSGNALIEVFDQGNDFTTAGIFTAPVSARYYFNGSLVFLQIVAATNTINVIDIVTSNRNYRIYDGSGQPVDANTQMGFSGSSLCDMDSGDTASIRGVSFNGAQVVDIQGATAANSRFSGFLVC